jgi:hypothetical protein
VGGLLAGIGILQIPDFGTEMSASAILLLAILGLTVGVAFVGGMIGFFIGWGIASGDRYVFADTIQHGEVLMRALVDIPRASRAWEIMREVAISNHQPE